MVRMRGADLQNPGELSPLFNVCAGNGHSGSAAGSADPAQLATPRDGGDNPLGQSLRESCRSPSPPPGLEGLRGPRGDGSPPRLQTVTAGTLPRCT